ncbi:MAG: phosphomannomutase/phosphoglucomutase [Gammaproteobacteria bacterium]
MTSGAAAGIDAGIFRAYDIRGLVKQNFTAEVVNQIGKAIGSEALRRGQQGIAVARDGRNSSPELAGSLIAGLRATGRDVIDIGMVPTPLLYFATHHLDLRSGVMLTGSHNGPEYNGLKIVLDGETLAEGAIEDLYKRIVAADFESGEGGLQTLDITADYVQRISSDIPDVAERPLQIVIDAGNGVAGAVAPRLLRALGHEVIELFCEVDGDFPNHHPDPTRPENLRTIIDKVKSEQADVGFAFDGDGDRLGVIDNNGKIIWPDRQLMLFATDVLSRNAGAAIIYDVKCSRYLRDVIEAAGGKAEMWRTGHSLIKARMKERDAPLAGEMSGHIFFKERWYGFDDALYVAARMVEIVVNSGSSVADLFAALPEGVATPEIKVEVAEEQHQAVMRGLKEKMPFSGAELIDVDGIRVEFADGWGLIRPSNTTPCLVLRFEAEDEAALDRIRQEFNGWLQSVNPALTIPDGNG